MSKTDLHKEMFDLQNIGRPYTTPDGYFDQLEKSVFNQIHTPIQPISKIISYSQWLKYAAIVTVGIFTTVMLIRFATNPDEPKIADSTQTPIEKHDTTNNQEFNTNIQDIAKESKNHNGETILPLEENNQDDKESVNYQKDITQPDKTSIAESDNNDNPSKNNHEIIQRKEIPILNNPQYPNIQNHNFNSIAQTPTIEKITNPISTARTSKPDNTKLISIPKDTCATSPLTLTAIESEDLWENYSFKWSTGDTTPYTTLQISGVYSVSVCNPSTKAVIESAVIKFNLVPLPEPDLGENEMFCSHETIYLDAKTYNSEYSYLWSMSHKNSPKIVLNNLTEGYHIIHLTVGACGQEVHSSKTVYINKCEISIPNVITPNGDGYNDRFVISGIEKYPGSQLFILNRDGQVLYQTLNYQNDWSAQNLPDGTYFYLLKLNDKNKTEKGGSITVHRQ